MNSPDTAIFLGAGASKAEGAPLQGELFREYFSSSLFKPTLHNRDGELATFFQIMFGIDLNRSDKANIDFPTFEEVLGLTDLAMMRKEGFRDFDLENRATNSGRLRPIAQELVFLVAKILDRKLGDRATLHQKLVNGIHSASKLRNVAFISTNYDILIDNALAELNVDGIDLDYGVDFRNFDRADDWSRPDTQRRVFLFKPHGSLNWLLCPTCNELEITPREKGVVTRLISTFDKAGCGECNSVYVPLIVPPTFYKDLNNVFLSTIWNRMERTLRKVSHIVFCGYSFPDADLHIKYLLKRAQTNRSHPTLKFTVINNHPGKDHTDARREEGRYKRFLGSGVDYSDKTFEDFANDPLSVITPAAASK